MSKIEVNQIGPQCGTTVTVGCGAGQTVAVDAATVNLGRSGGTVNLTCGATQSGFGRTGTVDWITTPKVTGDSPVTGVTGKGYFMNTTAGTITINLPAGAAGSIISVMDYAATWASNNVTVSPNGSEKIGGVNADVVLSTEGQSVTFVYVDSTQGWLNTMDSTSNVRGNEYIVATGGTPSQCGDYEIRTFTGPGTFCVSTLALSAPNNAVDYLVVAGGGGGGTNDGGGGGGAGGYRESPGTATGCYTVSPRGVAPAAAITVTASPYTITVGAAGAAVACSANGPGGNGGDSTFSTITSTGGGGGAQFNKPVPSGGGPKSGGSGGGGGGRAGCVGSCGGAASPVTSPYQGTAGGPATPGTSPGSIDAGGGGGGALCAGAAGAPNGPGGVGGAGGISSIDGTPTARSGGGGGGSESGPGGAGGNGGGGAGAGPGPGAATAATINTGGGGGGVGTGSCSSGAGGSGVVILRYKYK